MDRTPFGARLRAELDRQGISNRELARRLDPADPEGARRSIARWLAPRDRAVTPSRPNVAAIAAALGVQPEELQPEEDDDEESDLAATLVHTLKALMRHERRRAATGEPGVIRTFDLRQSEGADVDRTALQRPGAG
jgi:transcriptional regulator with XRE-family HTH domain